MIASVPALGAMTSSARIVESELRTSMFGIEVTRLDLRRSGDLLLRRDTGQRGVRLQVVELLDACVISRFGCTMSDDRVGTFRFGYARAMTPAQLARRTPLIRAVKSAT